MEHLALEVFDLTGSGSQFATLPPNTVIHIRRTSQIFGSGAVFSQEFTLNIPANAHLFGSAGDIHGSRLHEQMNKRKARIWAEGLPLYLGYLRLADEVDVDEDGNVGVTFESGQKTFEEMIEGTKAREVSVGDVVIGVALNRKRVSVVNDTMRVKFTMDGMKPYAVKDSRLKAAADHVYEYGYGRLGGKTSFVQRWPKLVKSYGEVLDSTGTAVTKDYTNIQTPYDADHPFCNINICYPLKVNDKGEEKSARGYTVRLARGQETTDGGDNQTRFNNAPNFYLLYFIDRLFKDMKIHVEENQAKNVEDLRRVFMLNYGCHYEEIEDTYQADELNLHTTPRDKTTRYGQYYIPIISKDDKLSLVKGWRGAGQFTFGDAKGLEYAGKVLMRNIEVTMGGNTSLLSIGSLEGFVQDVKIKLSNGEYGTNKHAMLLDKTTIESPDANKTGYYSAYLAYATGDNYPDVEINEIIEAMKSMFGVRFIFSEDYKRVRIVLLRNIFRSKEVQTIQCDIIGVPTKTENCIRGFRITYGKGTDSTSFYYKGFNDLFPRDSQIWKDTSDKHDYSQWDLDADYNDAKQSVSAFNKKCYVTPVNGNAYGTQVDEDEDVLFPSLFEWAGYMDAEDGDCSGEDDTIHEVQCGASPVLMNEIGETYASLFSGDMKAPAPNVTGSKEAEIDQCWDYVSWLSTYGRVTPVSVPMSYAVGDLMVKGDLDIYISEGFRIRLLDNYAISNGGTPFDEADTGLQFGIMRGSGAYSHVDYMPDDIENENPLNDYWEVTPGAGAIDHPDTCDNYGSLWDYDGGETDTIRTVSEAETELQKLFPNSNAMFRLPSRAYVTRARIFPIKIFGRYRNFLMVECYSDSDENFLTQDYTAWLANYPDGHSVNEIINMDQDTSSGGRQLIVEVDSTEERLATLLQLCEKAYKGKETADIIIDNGVSSQEGRFSLKLRAEKLNPYFDPKQPESENNRRYLEITNKNLQGRGLCDQFYKEYSYWMRNARIVNLPVRMELAQLLTIDDTVRATVGDVTGFINEMEYDISNETGLGNVTMQMMYI